MHTHTHTYTHRETRKQQANSQMLSYSHILPIRSWTCFVFNDIKVKNTLHTFPATICLLTTNVAILIYLITT